MLSDDEIGIFFELHETIRSFISFILHSGGVGVALCCVAFNCTLHSTRLASHYNLDRMDISIIR